MSDEEQATFLATAYRYLSERQTAIYKHEGESHQRDVEARCQRPPSVKDLYGEEQDQSPIVFARRAALPVLAASALLVITSLIVINIVPLFKEFSRFLFSADAIAIGLMTVAPIALNLIVELLF